MYKRQLLPSPERPLFNLAFSLRKLSLRPLHFPLQCHLENKHFVFSTKHVKMCLHCNLQFLNLYFHVNRFLTNCFILKLSINTTKLNTDLLFVVSDTFLPECHSEHYHFHSGWLIILFHPLFMKPVKPYGMNLIWITCPVSYTHLGVYKRQYLYWTAI